MAFIDTGEALQQEAHDELHKCDIVEAPLNSGLEWHCQCDLGASADVAVTARTVTTACSI